MDVTRVHTSIDNLLQESSKFLGEKAGGQSGSHKNPASGLIEKYSGQTPRDKEAQIKLGAHIAEKVGATKMVADARAKLAKAIPTNASEAEGGHMGKDGTWTQERSKLHHKLLSEIFTPEALARAKPEAGQKPVMVMLGGRGGSGKSWLTGPDGPVDTSKMILIDADHFKQALPEYEGWNAASLHEESSYLVDTAAQIAKAQGPKRGL